MAAASVAALPEEPVPPGVLTPSGTLKDVIDKTAAYYRKAGPSFEEKIFADHKSNPQFSFLFPNDPFHKYYLFRKGEWKVEEKPRELTVQTVVSEKAAIVAKPSLRPPPLPFSETPPPFEFILDRIPDITAQDLDIMKLTAQFVARNGREFHIGLVNKEAKNPQFDFLKLNHPLNPYFNQFVEAYNRVLLPRRDFLERLKRENQPDGKYLIMQRVFGRVEYQKKQEKAKQTEEDEEKERLARQAIDWHEFIVVETITFDEPAAAPPAAPPGAAVPAPTAPTATPAAAAATTTAKKDEEMEVEMETEEMEVEMVKPAPEMKIRKDYVVGQKTAAATRYQICPKCGQQIPTDEMAEHMKIELAGGGTKPKYKPGAANAALASNDEMAASLNVFARRRTDIFGGDELEARRREAAEKSKAAEKVTWDGHAASAEVTKAASLTQESKPSSAPSVGPQAPHLGASDVTSTATPTAPNVIIKQLAPVPAKPAPMPAFAPTGMPMPMNMPMNLMGLPPPTSVAPPPLPHLASIGLPPGLAPPPGLAFPPVPPPTAVPTTGHLHPSAEADDGPDSKRQRTEGEAHLMPEDAFLRSVPASYTVKIQCPNADEKPANSDWRISGQLIDVTVSPRDGVAAFKAKIKDATGVPANKQKLRVANGPVFRDVCSLAFYNVASNAVVELSLKERGGKKGK